MDSLIFFLLHIVLFFTSLFLVIVPLLFQKFSFLRTNLLFQFSSIYAKTRRSYDIIFFSFQKFPFDRISNSIQKSISKISNYFSSSKKKNPLVLSRYVRTNSSFSYFVVPIVYGRVYRGNNSERVIDLSKGWKRDYAVDRLDFHIAADGRHVRSRADHFPATVPM